MARRLNIGCGSQVVDGWVNADVAPSVPGAEQADICALPYPAESFDMAVAHHVLPQLTYPELLTALRELRRVLRPGGWLRLSVPNIEAGIRAWARNDSSWFPKIQGDETSLDGLFCTWATCYGAHTAVFTSKWLREICLRAGFVETHSVASGVSFSGLGGIARLDRRERESAFVEAVR